MKAVKKFKLNFPNTSGQFQKKIFKVDIKTDFENWIKQEIWRIGVWFWSFYPTFWSVNLFRLLIWKKRKSVGFRIKWQQVVNFNENFFCFPFQVF